MKKFPILARFASVAIALTALSLPAAAQDITRRLADLGMENIRCIHHGQSCTVAYEDNVYRGTYRGIGQAVQSALQGDEEAIELVVLRNSVPRLTVSLPAELVAAYRRGELTLKQVYAQMGISVDTDRAMQQLQEAERPQHSSAGKVDIVVYPSLFLENNTFDELYTYAVNLNPTLEMQLWRGARLSAQAIVPVSTNLSGEMGRIRPGVVTLAQEFRFRRNIFGRIAAGNFTNNRYGLLLDTRYRTADGRIELGAQLGSTGFSATTREDGWYMGRRQRINASLLAMYYLPELNIQADLRVGRFVYGDCGVRGDLTRHFGEYAIGVYGIYTDGEVNAGFHLTTPLPGRKWRRKGWVRVKPASYFQWQYGLVAHGEYFDKKMGRTYSTRPDDNRSADFYQPDYIRYFLIRDNK